MRGRSRSFLRSFKSPAPHRGYCCCWCCYYYRRSVQWMTTMIVVPCTTATTTLRRWFVLTCAWAAILDYAIVIKADYDNDHSEFLLSIISSRVREREERPSLSLSSCQCASLGALYRQPSAEAPNASSQGEQTDSYYIARREPESRTRTHTHSLISPRTV